MKRILLVEPNRALAKVYTDAFTTEGYAVTHAVSAQSAIDAADKSSPDVVVLELQLPRHNGIEFLHEFRSYPEWSSVPVVVLTLIAPNRITPVAKELERDFGIVAILYKPKTTLDVLRQTLKTHAALV